jgi:hypothetical protein
MDAYIRPKVVGSFPGPSASGSYVHLVALGVTLVELSFLKL